METTLEKNTDQQNHQKKIIIIGGGFGGLHAAKALRHIEGEIILIDKQNHHLFAPLLYQVASAALNPGDIASPLREIFRKQKNLHCLMGEVEHIDLQGRHITFFNGDQLPYDYLIIAIGTNPFYFNHATWPQFTVPLKSITDALSMREKMLLAFEKVEMHRNPREALPELNFVVVGGGPTGVELAGAIAEIAYKTMIRDFKYVTPRHARIYLIEASPRILPMFPTPLAQAAQRDLEKLGVRICLNTRVEDIDAQGLRFSQEGKTGTLLSHNIFWAAGNRPSPLLEKLGVPLDQKSGRVVVQADLSVAGHPEVFVIGDAAYCLDLNYKTSPQQQPQPSPPPPPPLPGLAPVATQQGKHAAFIIKRELARRRSQIPLNRPPFRYQDRGQLATIGKSKAVGLIRHWQITGVVAWILWSLVHISYLIGFKNRLFVMMAWMMNYFTQKRGVRLIHSSMDKRMWKKT